MGAAPFLLALALALPGCLIEEPSGVVASTLPACPDSTGEAKVTGEVWNSKLQPVRRASVTVRVYDRDGMTLQFLTTASDLEGDFEICSATTLHDYLLVASKDGYRPFEIRHHPEDPGTHHRMLLEPA